MLKRFWIKVQYIFTYKYLIPIGTGITVAFCGAVLWVMSRWLLYIGKILTFEVCCTAATVVNAKVVIHQHIIFGLSWVVEGEGLASVKVALGSRGRGACQCKGWPWWAEGEVLDGVKVALGNRGRGARQCEGGLGERNGSWSTVWGWPLLVFCQHFMMSNGTTYGEIGPTIAGHKAGCLP